MGGGVESCGRIRCPFPGKSRRSIETCIMAAIIHFLSDRGDLLYGGCSVLDSPPLCIGAYVHARHHLPCCLRNTPLYLVSIHRIHSCLYFHRVYSRHRSRGSLHFLSLSPGILPSVCCRRSIETAAWTAIKVLLLTISPAATGLWLRHNCSQQLHPRGVAANDRFEFTTSDPSAK